jgi:protein-disulfide isomerase
MVLGMAVPGAEPLVEGNPAGTVRVLIFEDLQCGDCAVLRQMMDEKILPKFGSKVAFEHREFPLPKHNWARHAAVAARHFHQIRPDLGLAWRRHALEQRASISAENFSDKLSQFATKHGADPKQAVSAMTDDRLLAEVEQDYKDGIARGVSRTPTVFVNGQPFVETFTFEELSAGIEKALASP